MAKSKVKWDRPPELQKPKRRKRGKREKREPIQERVQPDKRERFTVQLSADLIDKVRDAVFYTPGLTLSELAGVALRDALAALEAKRGEAFPARTGELKTGRPLKKG